MERGRGQDKDQREGDDAWEWVLKTRNIAGKKFTNVVDIADENYLVENLTEPNDLLNVHKELYIAKAKTENCIKNVASLSLKLHEKKNAEQPKSSNINVTRKEFLPKGLFLVAAVTFGFVIGKTLF